MPPGTRCLRPTAMPLLLPASMTFPPCFFYFFRKEYKCYYIISEKIYFNEEYTIYRGRYEISGKDVVIEGEKFTSTITTTENQKNEKDKSE